MWGEGKNSRVLWLGLSLLGIMNLWTVNLTSISQIFFLLSLHGTGYLERVSNRDFPSTRPVRLWKYPGSLGFHCLRERLVRKSKVLCDTLKWFPPPPRPQLLEAGEDFSLIFTGNLAKLLAVLHLYTIS